MKKTANLTILILLLIFSSCSKKDGDLTSSDSMSESSSDNGDQGQAGLITAGEWNDLLNWFFWKNLLIEQDYLQMSSYWDFHTNNRLSFLVLNSNTPVINAKVEILRNESVLWTAKTDNHGYAELWVGMFQREESIDLSNLTIKVNDVIQSQELVLIENGVNEININSNTDDLNRVEISFIVDATGSMGDELEFLKEDLKSVIDRVKNDDANLDISTSTVFYRDEGDDYVTRKSEFTGDLNKTIDFINQQSANGGGDFPEAVHSALNVGINELQWSDNAKTRIAFLLLDAPPHYETDIVNNIHDIIRDASQKGIKIIPITASGIDKETEFLMRFMAILTNGTYVFITNDSGIGNDHLVPSVGQYEVEYLNDLMVRLIKEYSE
tara:strand:- start:635 stop:1780 length:1146 start_codon:yes stop_codon:yes gene_type:complete